MQKEPGAHICPVLADVGFHKLRFQSLQSIADHGPEDPLLVESDRWTAVESHICQNRADMGHPCFVTDQAVRN